MKYRLVEYIEPLLTLFLHMGWDGSERDVKVEGKDVHMAAEPYLVMSWCDTMVTHHFSDKKEADCNN